MNNPCSPYETYESVTCLTTKKWCVSWYSVVAGFPRSEPLGEQGLSHRWASFINLNSRRYGGWGRAEDQPMHLLHQTGQSISVTQCRVARRRWQAALCERDYRRTGLYLWVPPCATLSPSMQKMVLPIHSLLLETDAPALVRRCSHTTQCHACCHIIAGNMVLTLSVGRKAGYCSVCMSAETGVVNVPTALPVSRGQVAVFKSGAEWWLSGQHRAPSDCSSAAHPVITTTQP